MIWRLAIWILLSCSVVILGLLVWVLGPGPLFETKVVAVPPGHASAIAHLLAEAQVIRSSWLFQVVVRLGGTERELRAGEYRFARAASLIEVIDQLRQGGGVLHRLTIPEGWGSQQIVQLVEQHPLLDGSLDSLPPEGALLPDTYFFARGTSSQRLIDTMRQAMDQLVDQAWAERERELPLSSPQAAVVLASLVEKEAPAGERARVAGVFINRLRLGMKLQSDPTVIYALTQGSSQGSQSPGRRLIYADLQVDSPYNTYRITGLPPQPITNPGREAILASLHPEHHSYLYFVANGAGGHAFATTLAEHNRNVDRYRQLTNSDDRDS